MVADRALHPGALPDERGTGQAKTGTGKTLGFGVPLLQRIASDRVNGAIPQTLVVVPTRELCVQVAKDLELAGARQGTRVLAVYGGRSYEPQVEAHVWRAHAMDKPEIIA